MNIDFMFLHGVVNPKANIIASGSYSVEVTDFDSFSAFWNPIQVELSVINKKINEVNIDNSDSYNDIKSLLDYAKSIFLYFKDMEASARILPDILDIKGKIPEQNLTAKIVIPVVRHYYEGLLTYSKNALTIIKGDINRSSSDKLKFANTLREYKEFYKREFAAVSSNELKSNTGAKIKNPVIYCLEHAKIKSLYDVINCKVIENMEFNKFLECFDLYNKPTTKPKYLRNYQRLFVYALSLITPAINEQMAYSNFGISNYYQQKSKALSIKIPKSRKIIETEIKNCLVQVTYN